MPLYVSDYLGDTRRLTTLEHGAYLLLIMEYWLHGGIPDDDSELAEIAGLEPEEWARIRNRLARLFMPGWRHKRIDAELAKAAEISGKRKANAERRWSKGNAIALQEQVTCNARARVPQPQPQPPSSSTSEEDILLPLSDEPKKAKPKRNKNEYPDDFERFWRDYPRSPNMSKPQALKEWKKLGPEDRDAAIRSLPAFKGWIRTQANYSPIYAERYLSYRRFEGHAKTAEVITTSFVVVQQQSPEGQAWEQFTRKTKGKGVPWTNGIWRFPTQFPPEMRAAE